MTRKSAGNKLAPIRENRPAVRAETAPPEIEQRLTSHDLLARGYAVYCTNCSEKILGEPLRQGGECFCSAECASVAQGVDPDDSMVYEIQDFDEDFFEEEQ